MLFKMKNTLSGTLILTFYLAVAALLLQDAMNLEWDVFWREGTLGAIVLALIVLLIGDGAVQALMRMIYGPQFQNTFDRFLDKVVVGEWQVVLIVAVTAAAEEMFFRGVWLQAMLQYDWSPFWAVLLSTALFNLAHYFDEEGIRFWLLTSIWEGLVLGITYALTGSLLVIMIVHGIHDVLNGGAAIWLVQRKKKQQAKA